MEKSTSKPFTLRTSLEVREDFKRTYELSGTPSQSEFLGKLLQKWNTPETANPLAIVEQIETPLNLSPEETQEMLKSSFEASEAFTMDEFLDNLLQNYKKPEKVAEPEPKPESNQSQLQPNEILLSLTPSQMYALRETVLSRKFTENQNDSIDEKQRGDFYSGKLCRPEFKGLCVRNIILTDDMDEVQKETAIKHDIAALPINIFLMRLIQGNLSNSTTITAKSLKSFIEEHPEVSPSEFSIRLSEKDETILSLTPAQLYALRETVLSSEDFAEKQNEIIDSMNPENRPFLYFGNLFEPEFQLLWVRNIVLADNMTADQKEAAIRHNMTAFLINMFLMHLIEGKIYDTSVTAKSLNLFIQEHDQDFLLKAKEAINQ